MGVKAEENMLTESSVKQFADDWVRAWNSHDLDAIMSHYAPQVVLTSPVAARLLNNEAGVVAGKSALRSYFECGLKPTPTSPLNCWT